MHSLRTRSLESAAKLLRIAKSCRTWSEQPSSVASLCHFDRCRESDCSQTPPRIADIHALTAVRDLRTSATQWRGGYGQAETVDSRNRRDTLEEEPSAVLSGEDETALQGEADQETGTYQPLPRARASSRRPSEQYADRALQIDYGQDLRIADLANDEKRKALLEKIEMGKLDLFGSLPSSESSLPEAEMRAWMRDFRIKVVDVNRISKGSRTGGIGRFSALAVVGNGNGVIGLGTGKSKNISDAIKKANHQALGTLFYVPRYKEATILQPIVARYGRCKVTMYPRSTGSGCKASILVSHVCQLAGIRDIGVKVHGTRNVRNTVKALIRGFESQTPEQELADIPDVTAAARLGTSNLARNQGVATVQSIGG